MKMRDLMLRYQNDVEFRVLVCEVKKLIDEGACSPLDLKEAARLAAELWVFEESQRNPPKIGDLGIIGEKRFWERQNKPVKPDIVIDE